MLAARHAVKIDTASECMNFMITLRLCIVVFGTGRLRYSALFSGFPQQRCDVCDFASNAYPEDVRCESATGGKTDVTRTSDSYSTLRFDLRMISPQRAISDLM